jgi:chromosome segregation ATPase
MTVEKCENQYCDYHALCRDKVERHDDDIKCINNKVNEIEKTVAVFDVELREAVKQMAKLPEAIEKLTASNIDLHSKVDNTCEKVDSLKTEIDGYKQELTKIDIKAEEANNKFKVDIWKDIIKPNLWKIISGLVIAGYIIYNIIENNS